MNADKRVDIPVLLDLGDVTIEASAQVPCGLMRPADLVPLFLGVTEAVVSAAGQGRTISCRAGCGACCRQLVPISEAEAQYVAELIADMPPERQAVIRSRFAAALAALGDSIINRLGDTSALKDLGQRREIGMEYFARGVACPFLEQESCSIHENRPAACREYLVTSPAANCATPGPGRIDMVPLTVKPSTILFCFGDGIGRESTRWMPLVLALEWAEARAQKTQAVFDGPQMFRNFISQVKRAAGNPPRPEVSGGQAKPPVPRFE